MVQSFGGISPAWPAGSKAETAWWKGMAEERFSLLDSHEAKQEEVA